jgi:MFS transporter, SHS family, lactate transporter
MTAAPKGNDHRHAVAASFLGWTLDAFDFFIVVFVLTDIAREFGKTKTEMAAAITLTLAMRPLGALLFGLLADRYGRRLPLMIDLVFFSVVEVLSGLAPDYRTFMILRALFGIGMGGEWGVGASLAMEKAPRRRRGILSGFLQEGYACGYLLAACCYLFVFPHWGWRPMFFLGGLPALLAVYVRLGVAESEVWQRTKSADWSHLGRAIVSNWKIFLYLFVLMTMMNFVSHGTQDLYPTFLKEQRGFDEHGVSYVAMIYNVGAIIGGLVMGHYSDRVGRRRSMITSLLLAIVVIPLWAYAPTTALLVLGAFLLQFMVQGAWGVVPAHINELAPDGVRGFLPGFAYQCGVAVAGTAPTIQSALVEHGRLSYSAAMALTAVTVFSLAAVVVYLGRERHASEFGIADPSSAERARI